MQEAIQITLMNLRSIPSRLGASLVICVGIAGVVAVLTSVLTMARGLSDTLASAGEPDRVLVFRKGAIAESLSSLSRDAVLAVESAPGIRVANGAPAVSPEVILSVTLPRKDEDRDSGLFVRGLGPAAHLVRPEIAIDQGRMFEPGRYEVVAGRAASRSFDNLTPGERIKFHGQDWNVVGTFVTHGDAAENQLLTDAATLMSAANRSVFNAVTIRLEEESGFAAFQEAVLANPQLKVQVERESDYYQRQSEDTGQLLNFVAYVVGSIMAIGALCGAVNTMYAAVSARTVEIATLRALGFGSSSVVISVLAEAMLLSLIGALVGVSIAWLLFNGDDFATGGSLSLITATLRVDGTMMATGATWALIIGFLGGFFPALRAARMPITQALRVAG